MKALNEAFRSNILTKELALLDASSVPGVPEGIFPKNMHPILTVNGLSTDIRMSALQISGPLLTSSSMLPFVSYKGSEKPMLAPLNGYIGGQNRGTLIDRLRLAGVVPALVSSLVDGIALRLGDFLPANAAYECDDNGECHANSKWVFLGNELSGPGVYVEAIEIAFKNTSVPLYSLGFLSDVINQPLILKGVMTGKCQQNSYFFNETTAQVQFRSGDVTLFPGASGIGLTKGSLQGEYTGMHGFSACAQNVGFTARDCKDFA